MDINRNLNFFKMDNIIQNYKWGSTSSFQNLFNIKNLEHKPQAEIWMGAHINGPSSIRVNGEKLSLPQFIASDPIAILGENNARAFGELPYLFKVLAADKALSIQVHPTKIQAEIGFLKEDQQRISIDAFNRNYKDPNHKPELIYALTSYQAMNGFRPVDQILNLFSIMKISELSLLVSALNKSQDEKGLEIFFEALLRLDNSIKNVAIEKLISYSKKESNDLSKLILELSSQYPGDIGLFAPLLLNVITLEPNQAMFLDASTPHAYIKGTGLEIMANSDNVLRAGLTPKYMDISELIQNTSFKSKTIDDLIFKPKIKNCLEEFLPPVKDFKLSIYNSRCDFLNEVTSAEILFALEGDLTLTHISGETLMVKQGNSVFIPAYVQTYMVKSDGRFVRAYN